MKGSPFRIFRKHQRLLMALLIGLAMFAFVFLGSLPGIGSSGAQGLVPLVFVLLGAAAFWLVGTQLGNPSTYALIGALLGAAVGFWFPRMGGPKPAVETSVGDISSRDLQLLVRKRNIANQFIQRIYAEGFPPPSSQDNPMIQQLMLQFWRQGLERSLFRIDPRLPVERDVVLAYLLRKEADRLGLTVGDQVITDYIKQVSRGKLSTERFHEILADLGLTENVLYDILREELKAQLALQLLAPPAVDTPQEQWENYRKMNVRASIEVAAVSVEEFLSQVPDPSEEELRSFFDQYKNYFPDELGPGTPGFRQPRRLQLAYVEADRRSMEKKIKPVTDEDIVRFYEENKDQLYRLPPLSTEQGEEQKSSAGTAQPSGLKEEGPGKQPSGADKTSAVPKNKSDQAVQPETPQTTNAKQFGQTKTSTNDQPSARPAPQDQHKSSKSEHLDRPKPAPGPSTSSQASEAAEKAGAATERNNSGAQFSVESQAIQNTQEETSQEQSQIPKGSSGTAARPAGANEPTAAEHQEAGVASKASVPADDTGHHHSKPSGSANGPAAAEAAGRPDSNQSSAAVDTEPKSAGSKHNAAPKGQPESKASGAKGSAASSGNAPQPGEQKKTGQKKNESKAETPRYRPLDKSLKEEIRLRLVEQRIDEAIAQVIQKVVEKMRELGARHAAPKPSPDHLEPEQVIAELRSYAAELGLHYEETPPLSARELSESQSFPIGQAVEVLGSGELGTETVVDRLFNTETAFLFAPDIAQDPITGSRFAYWVIKEIPAHVPEFGEPAMREQVLKAWKMLKARPLAEQRAQELAKVASKALSAKGSTKATAESEPVAKQEKSEQAGQSARSLADVLKGQTVTGQDNAPPVPVHTVPEFSWLTVTTSSVPPSNPFQPPPTAVQLTDLAPSVQKAGEQFMETVFRKLKPGEVGVAPNADTTVYYVIYVKSRSDSDPAFEEQLRERFLKENPFVSQPLQWLANVQRGDIYFRWLEQLQQRFQVRWNELEKQSG